jgi:transposase
MERKNARNLSATALTDLRTRAIRAVLDGESPEVVARVLHVHRSTMYGWLARYAQGGLGALNAKKRGGRKPLLDAKSIKWLYRVLVGKNPLQLHFPFALWTSKMVSRVIYDKYGIRTSKATTCRLMNQMGLSPQRPLWRAYQQNPELVEQWIQKDFPAIRKKAKKVGAQIYFCDEAGVRSDFHCGTTWAPVGKTPVVQSSGARFGLNLVSAVTNRGDMRFMITEGRITARVFVEFLKRLVHGSDKPIYLIADGHPIHKAKMVNEFLLSTKGLLKIFYLPPYSPELNPDELVWANLKRRVGRKVANGVESLKKIVHSDMKSIQNDNGLVQSFFQLKTTMYAFM